MTNHGLKAKHIEITDEAMTELVRSYTHEAGVRNLEREIANVMRKVARQVAEGRKRKTVVDAKKLAEFLGPQRFEYGELEAEDQTGSATGLVVTEVGGDVVAIEVTRMEGTRGLHPHRPAGRGHARERAGRPVVDPGACPRARHRRARSSRRTPSTSTSRPARSPRTGRRPGITMATAIVSALTGIPVRKDVAMTGEITLRGRVLPIGGLKSKILAAHLSGAKIVILPRKNEKDLRDIPDEIRKSMKLILVDSMEQVLEAALRRKPKALVAEPPKVVKGDDPIEPEPETTRPPDELPADRPAPGRGRAALTMVAATAARCRRCRLRALATHLEVRSRACSAGDLASDAPAAAPDAVVQAMEYKDYYAVLGVPRTASQSDIKKAFRKLARAAPPRHQHGRRRGRAAVQGGQRGERRPVRSGQARALRPPGQGLGGVRPGRATAGAAAGGARRRRPAAARSPGSPASVARAAASATSSTRPATPASSATSSRRSSAARPSRSASTGPGRGRRPTGGPTFEDILAGMGLDARRRDRVPAAHRPAAARRPDARPSAEAIAEITLDEAYHGTTRLVEVDGKRLEVTIPKGADTGTRIRLTGKAPGGGDLYVVVRQRRDPDFTRRGADLERELPLTLGEALLGAEVPVRTLKGRVLLTIPAGTQTGRTFRLTGQGMPRFKADGHGDLYVKARVVLPTDLSEDARRPPPSASSTSPTNPTPAARET